MKLYDRSGTPNAARIRIVLAAKGLEDQVTFVPVDLRAAEQKSPAFLKMNPIGKTPVLQLDDGLCISECTAITEYLDTLDGKPVFTGRTPRERAIVHMMQRRVEAMVMEGVDDYFHYATPGLGAALRPWRMPDWAGAKEWAERRGAAAVGNLAYFEGVLRERAYLAGDVFSMADVTLWAALVFARAIKLQGADGFAVLEDWSARVDALPCVRERSGKTL